MLFYKETDFQETPIGKIPRDWELKELKELVTNDKFAIVDGPFGTQLHSNEYVDRGIPLIRVDNINKDGSFNPNNLVYITEEKWEKLKRSAIFPGDILLAKTGATIGKVCLFPESFEKGLIASSCAKISIDSSKAHNRYIFYFLLSNFGYFQILALATGSTRPTINLTPIGKVKVAVPKNIKEQQKIAEILSIVDKAIQRTDEIITKTERLKKGLMQELLTKGIGHKEFKNTEIGRIPKEWEVVKLGDKELVEIIMGQSPPSSTYNREGKGLPFLQGKMEFGDIYPSPIMYCSQPIKIAEPNDILISVRAPVGDVNIAPYKLCIGRGLAAIRFNLNRASHWFYFYYFQKIKNFLENLGKGSTFKAITKEDLENLKVPYPPLCEQQKIAEILSTLDKRLEIERKEKAKLERIKQGLMDLLLTGKVRVRIEGVK
jgi:type I restriction enzyme S subunit